MASKNYCPYFKEEQLQWRWSKRHEFLFKTCTLPHLSTQKSICRAPVLITWLESITSGWFFSYGTELLNNLHPFLYLDETSTPRRHRMCSTASLVSKKWDQTHIFQSKVQELWTLRSQGMSSACACRWGGHRVRNISVSESQLGYLGYL